MKTGRPPKPEGTTIHRNRPHHETVLLPAAGRPGPAPEPITELFEEAAKLWARLWATPEATMWGEADVPGLTRMVALVSNPETWIDSKLVGELRNLEDRYGCNPYSRRVAKWVHEEATKEPKRSTPSKSRPRKLRVVDGKAS